ncbi:MAG: dihydroorotate dehydrogenase electron transfer subunit [Bacilli bacterium]
MLKQSKIAIISNELIAMDTYKMVLDKSIKAQSGQFINIKLKEHFLRRPISISKINKYSFEIIYKIKGFGTKDLANNKQGELLDILYPLGNGFELVKGKKVLLIGGGIGVPPLLNLYDDLKNSNEVKLLIGLNSRSENAYSNYNPIVCTNDNSGDYVGTVIDYVNNHDLDYNYIYACGPKGMLQIINEYDIDGQISIEERMGCGFGACMGCSCKTTNGDYKRICVDGPVFKIGEIDLNEY